jgi:putative membrane protein
MKEENMNKEKPATWKEAFNASPGPGSFKAAGLLFLKGICMGSADIIPGVSGGTIALITGIYETLLRAIRSVGLEMVNRLFLFDFKGALAQVHIRFLIPLFLGICLAIVSLARLMNTLLHHYPVFTWSLFFGLIAASILVVGKKVKGWKGGPVIWFLLGAAAAYVIVSMIPVSTPETSWFIFISGLIAICAMILPGLSGAFLLLILGKYEYITGALKNPFLPEHLLIILVFCAGCITGLVAFSRVLNYFLERYRNVTLAFLTGLMTGSMKKIWPWKEVLETRMIREKSHDLVIQNIWPQALDKDFYIAISLAIIGFIVVILLSRLSDENE